ncbi:hypothetical protein Pan153_44830 [Gimesia panareensis]|uniref:Uncharacterized protein n=1 Tax=Gimesia panareensis TaxID=2527978 RepID=A0A518FTZ3_9PLAN|nr:hypothetical protein [Gimesia panareensis]QDV19814.1 hypothetical protein Pan153_44830 [Gimesia panareensis]
MQKVIKHNSLLNKLVLLGGFVLLAFGIITNGLVMLSGAVLISGAIIAENLNSQLAAQVIHSDQDQDERLSV